LGSVVTTLACSSISDIESQSWAPEQTEADRLAGYVALDATRPADEVAPNLLDIGETSTPEMEISHPILTQRSFTLFGVAEGEVTILDSTLPSISESLSILSSGMMGVCAEP